MSVNEFELAAVSRDLARNPEVKIIALALARLYIPTGGVVDKENVPPLYIMMGHTLIKNRAKREAFLALLEQLV